MSKDIKQMPFCSSSTQDNWSQLHATARIFLESLDLPTIHPRCDDEVDKNLHEYFPTPVPSINQLDLLSLTSSSASPTKSFAFDNENLYYEQNMPITSNFVTLWYQVSPALLAMTELWLRLFAFILAPLIVCYLLGGLLGLEFRSRGLGSKIDTLSSASASSSSSSSASSLSSTNENEEKTQVSKTQERNKVLILTVGLASSLVLLTDSMYVLVYDGRYHGASFFIVISVLTMKLCKKFRYYSKHMYAILIAIIGLVIYLILHSDRQGMGTFDSPGIDLPTIQPGFYYAESNEFMSNVAKLWPEHTRTYTAQNGATPYLHTGDSLTGIPFLVNKSPDPKYHRVWVENTIDYEAVALDIAFPHDGVHSSTKPIILILHGLNGGSHEEYVKEFVMRRTKEGHTCIVMIARGLMDTPVLGWNVFHGARISDVNAASEVISKVKAPHQILAGVGYSMGAIIISNYVARSGPNCHLDAAMAISGGLDMREMLSSKRSMRLWQPMLAQTLRDEFIIQKFDSRFRFKLSAEQHLALMRASSVSEIDKYAIVAYNGFNDLEHYYSEMSAMSDTAGFRSQSENGTPSTDDVGRIADVSIPFCVLHALDDPLTSWRTIGHNPKKLVNTGSGNIMMVLTKTGGHVGWPLGLNPSKNGWKFMNDAAVNFFNSVDMAKNGAK